MQIHDFSAPRQGDYANVGALNRAWLALDGRLGAAQQQRLAEAPFLLFSLRESDLDWWRRVLAADGQQDLLDPPACEARRRLQAAALAFLWHLAHRDAYATRVLSGANVAWCELLTRVPLLQLIDRVADRADLATGRLDTTECIELAADGASQRRDIRRSSQMTAWQRLLTQCDDERHASMKAAACRMPELPIRSGK